MDLEDAAGDRGRGDRHRRNGGAGECHPDAGELGAQWTATADGPATYPGMDIAWDVPIRMSDGVILKANVYRPADADGRPVDTPFPTIVSMTPYTKLVSALAEAAVSAPGISDAVMDFARDINFSGTPLSGITDLTRALSGGGLRTFTVDRELIRSGYTQVVVDVRGTGSRRGSGRCSRSASSRTPSRPSSGPRSRRGRTAESA